MGYKEARGASTYGTPARELTYRVSAGRTRFLEFLGTLNVEGELVHGDYADLATQLREGKIDAFFAGPPAASSR